MPEEIQRGPESGYICVWGTTTREKVVDREGIVAGCPGCGEEARLIGKRAQPYCSVFYIPLIPEGQGEDFFECTNCGGKYQGSIEDIRRGMSQRTEEAEAQVVEGRRALEQDPTNVDIASDLAVALMQLDRVAEARRVAEDLVSRLPGDANALLLSGRILIRQGHWVEAMSVLDRSVAINPQHAGAHFHRAVALAEGPTPRFEEAIEAAREAHRCGHPQARELIEVIEQTQREQG